MYMLFMETFALSLVLMIAVCILICMPIYFLKYDLAKKTEIWHIYLMCLAISLIRGIYAV